MMKQYEAIREGVDQIRKGNAGYQIPIMGEPRGEMQTLDIHQKYVCGGWNPSIFCF